VRRSTLERLERMESAFLPFTHRRAPSTSGPCPFRSSWDSSPNSRAPVLGHRAGPWERRWGGLVTSASEIGKVLNDHRGGSIPRRPKKSCVPTSNNYS